MGGFRWNWHAYSLSGLIHSWGWPWRIRGRPGRWRPTSSFPTRMGVRTVGLTRLYTTKQSPHIYVFWFIVSYGFKLFSLVTEKIKYEMQRDGVGENWRLHGWTDFNSPKIVNNFALDKLSTRATYGRFAWATARNGCRMTKSRFCLGCHFKTLRARWLKF